MNQPAAIPAYFEKKFWELLPSIYRQQDDSGDLANFLRVPSPTLDEIKQLADRFPEILDVDRCEPRFLPLLAAIVGHSFNPLADQVRERRAIREAVERYRRKGTIPAIRRTLRPLGWQGDVEETYRRALRLGQRSRLNQQRLPGLIYSFGVWRIRSESALGLGPAVRAALPFHQPAGTRVYFVELVSSLIEGGADSESVIAAIIRETTYADMRRVFVLNFSGLNRGDHLTVWRRTGALLEARISSTTSHRADRAATCISRWEARRPGFRTNHGRLGERLVNLWISQNRFSSCCEIATGSTPARPTPVIRFTGQRLGRARLNHSRRSCGFRFRQRDLVSEVAGGPQLAANLFLAFESPAPPTVQLESQELAWISAAVTLVTAFQLPVEEEATAP